MMTMKPTSQFSRAQWGEFYAKYQGPLKSKLWHFWPENVVSDHNVCKCTSAWDQSHGTGTSASNGVPSVFRGGTDQTQVFPECFKYDKKNVFVILLEFHLGDFLLQEKVFCCSCWYGCCFWCRFKYQYISVDFF